MEHFPQFEPLRRDEEVLRYQFISTELDLALTFIGISRSTDDEERSERNLNHANKAVEAAKKYVGGTNLSTSKRAELVEKLQKLERLLASHRRGSQTVSRDYDHTRCGSKRSRRQLKLLAVHPTLE